MGVTDLVFAGLAVVPVCPRTKRPTVRWTEYQLRPPTAAEAAQWDFSGGVGYVCGEASGGIEVLDFDVPDKPASSEPPAWGPWLEIVREHAPGLADRLCVVRTPSGGRHVPYRCPEPGRNQKLACLPDGRATIETRGQGGFVVCPPTPGYEWERGDEHSIPTLTGAERDLLIAAARLLDRREPEPERADARPAPPAGGRPGDELAERVSWEEILEPRGWRKVGRWAGQTLWRRPGKPDGWSAKTGPGSAGDRFYCWSTNAGVPAGRALTKFGLLAWLEHGGDFASCARALAARGYGSRPTGSVPAANGDTEAGADGRPVIVCSNRQLRDLSQEALAALLAANDPPTLFARSGEVVRVTFDEHGSARIEPATLPAIRGMLARAADWVRATKDGPVSVNPPKDVAEDLFALGAWPGLPPLAGVSMAPVVGPGGSFRTGGGYDPDSRTFCAWSEPVPEFEGGAREAAEWILGEVLGDFPFAGDADRAHALALLLLPFVRPAVRGSTPLHLVDAPVQGTGKSLLVKACLAPSQGASVKATGGTRDEEEWRKRLASALREGRGYVFLDNLSRRLDSETLAGILTSDVWTDRVLGSLSTVDLPVRCVWAATGNNVELSRDIVRRTVWIRLDARVERPEERDGFRHDDLVGWILANRARVVSAVARIVRSWLEAGRAPWTGRRLGSFEDWARTMGGILEHCGVPGFLGNLEELRAHSDREEEAWRGFVERWWEAHGSSLVRASDVFEIAKEDEAMQAMIDGGGSELAAKNRLGRAIQKRIGRIYSGKRIELGEGRRNSVRYRLSEAPQA